MMDPSRLGVGVIGAGKVGPVIAAALAGAGHSLVGITPPGTDRERVEAMLPGVPFLEPQVLCERSELVVLALPDGCPAVWSWLQPRRPRALTSFAALRRDYFSTLGKQH